MTAIRGHSLRAALGSAIVLAAILIALLPALPSFGPGPVHVVAREVGGNVGHERLFDLPIAASHVTFHWQGAPDARLTVRLGATADTLGEAIPVDVDADSGNDGAAAVAAETYGDVIWAAGARVALVTSDRPIGHLTVVALDATDRRIGVHVAPSTADAALSQPTVIPRSGWGADESYRFDSGGHERFAESYYPLQVMIVHHTAGRNNDPDPEATIRAIYYDHAVIRGYGDIDYNFLIDAQGHIYEGRHSRDYAAGESPTGEDLAGNVVRGTHARDYNEGTVGIVLLGNFTSVMPTAAATTSLEKLLAWKAERHGIDPKGQTLYKNPELGNEKLLNNISGHRNVNQTACPGDLFYSWFPTLRQHVADRIAASTGPSHDTTAPSVKSLKPMTPSPTGSHTLQFGLIFNEPVTGLSAGDFTVGGSSDGWSVTGVTNRDETYGVTVAHDDTGGPPPDGNVTLTLKADAVTDLAAHAGPGSPATATASFETDTTAPTVLLYQSPHRSASNATFFDFSATFSEWVKGFTASDIQIGGTSTPWVVPRIFGQGGTWSFSVDGDTVNDGTLTVQLPAGSMTDLAGNPLKASNKVSLVIDRHAPTAGTPQVKLRSGTTLNGSADRVRVSWTGTDVGPAGIASYDVARSYDGAAFETIGSALSGTSLDWSMTPGHTYRFEVRARDKAGNVGAWRATPTLTAAITQQTSSAVHFSGSTTTTTYSLYSGGSERYLAAAGASASYTTTARSLSFITTRGPTRGAVKVYIDGVLKATIDLAASTTTYRWVAYAASWSTAGTHTIKVVAVGTAGRPRVDVDAFGVIR